MTVVARLDIEGEQETDEDGRGEGGREEEEVTCRTCLTFLLADEEEEEPVDFTVPSLATQT